MGLDIIVYSNIEFVGPHDDNAEIRVCSDGFDDQLDKLTEGSYRTTDDSEDVSFRAGSYSGYNSWRNNLCRFAHGINAELLWDNPEEFRGRPFFELINFSDCEGSIGPETSAKLHEDFMSHRDEMLSWVDKELSSYDGDWFVQSYDNWLKAFEIASHSGVVCFH